MRKFRKQGKFLCVAIAGMLVLGDCTTCPVYASELPSGDVCPESADEAEIINITELTDEQQAGYYDDSVLVDDPIADIAELTDEQLAEYYGDSVFIGDSIMEGFRLYSVRQDNFVHDIQFLTAISYSVHNALRPVKGKNPHPEYQGEKYHLWDVLPLLGKKRVFIMLGTNDLIGYGLEANRDKYKELIDKILETSPDMENHIVSVPYTVKGKEKGCLSNPNIDIYNSLLREMAIENGWGYIDLCTAISDGEGNLEASLSSDKFVHLKTSAYALWEDELINYANTMLLKTEAEEETETEAEEEAEAGVEEGTLEEEETEEIYTQENQ